MPTSHAASAPAKTTSTPRARIGAAWMLLAQALFAIMSIGARVGSARTPWQEVLATRFVIGALTAYALAVSRGKPLRIVNQRRAWMRTGFGTISALATFYTLSESGVAVGDVVTLFATSPIFVSILSWPLLGERVKVTVFFALFLAFAGVVAVARPSLGGAVHVHLLASGLLAAVASAFAMIWLRKIGPEESSEAIVFHFSFIGAMVGIGASLPVWITPAPAGAFVLILTGVSGGLAQICMTNAYANDRAARISAIGYFGVLFTRAFAFPVFGERPDAAQILGSLLVIAAGALLAFTGRERVTQ